MLVADARVRGTEYKSDEDHLEHVLEHLDNRMLHTGKLHIIRIQKNQYLLAIEFLRNAISSGKLMRKNNVAYWKKR